jgi:hypothetical protein
MLFKDDIVELEDDSESCKENFEDKSCNEEQNSMHHKQRSSRKQSPKVLRKANGWIIHWKQFVPLKLGEVTSPGPTNLPPTFTSTETKKCFDEMDSYNLFVVSLLQFIFNKMDINFHNGKQLSFQDILLYDSIKLVMRLCPKPSMEDHWSLDLTKGTGVWGTPFIKMAMSSKLFMAIHSRFLDVINDENNLTELALLANEIVRKYWNPHSKISLDDGFPSYDGLSIYTLRKQRKVHQKGTKYQHSL